MIVIETLVICDGCSDNGSGGDDRDLNAAQIRANRKKYGWIQRGSKDYCDACVGQGKHKAKEHNAHLLPPRRTWPFLRGTG